MTKKGERILKVLSEHQDGIKASDIATILGFTRREVNQFLTYEQTEYIKTDDYLWVSKNKKTSELIERTNNLDRMINELAIRLGVNFTSKVNPVIAKLNNKEKAKTFTHSQFRALADWSYGHSQGEQKPKGVFKTKTGNRIEYDSSLELKMLEYLEKNDLVKEIGGQSLCIKYSSPYRCGLNYYPDIVVYTKDERIAIIEIKPATSMSYHQNIDKYEELKTYCKKKGFMYMMVDPENDYMTIDDLEKMKIPKEIVVRVESYLKNILGKTDDCLLEKDDISILYEQFEEEYTKGEFELYLHALIIQKSWYNKFKHGFMVFENPVQ